MLEKKISAICKYLLCLLFFTSGLSFAFSQSDYYVSDIIGDDNFSGSISQPFKTINKGISQVEAGGTVFVMNGTYRNSGYGSVSLDPYQNTNNEHVVTINKSGEENAYITLKNYDNHTPKIEFDGKGGIIINSDINYIIIEGFTVEGPSSNISYSQAIADRNYKIQKFNETGSGSAYNSQVSYFSGKGIWGGYGAHNNIIIRNNIVYNTPGSGIRFNKSDYITIEYNTVYNTTWWTSSASSAIVLAETIAVDGDNTTATKMIFRGNTVYNNWNRIPFFMTSPPDNSILPSLEYGNAAYNNILDGQGIYVTRSDENYQGTFLIENNLCVNNGKNGINFDRSLAGSVVVQNNTLYFNGVHEIVQDLSEVEGNPTHRGQKVGGIKANYVKNITVANNIVVTRDNNFTALETPNFTGTRIITNNIFKNGKLPSDSDVTCCNQVDVDPLLVDVPTTANDATTMSQWAGYLQGTDFSLSANSPAIDAGNQNYAPTVDIDGNSRPVPDTNVISSTSFELSTDGWSNFGATTQTSSSTAKTGEASLKVTNRSEEWHSAKLDLDGILTVGETYTFYVWVKLGDGVSGKAKLTIKQTTNGTASYTNLSLEIDASSSNWVRLNGNFTHTAADDTFVYVKGPAIDALHSGDFYIDDFSLVTENSQEVDFSSFGDTIDIGAYEYSAPLSTESPTGTLLNIIAYPNPVSDFITLINLNGQESIAVHNILGKKIKLPTLQLDKSVQINFSTLKTGIYFVTVLKEDGDSKTIQIIKK